MKFWKTTVLSVFLIVSLFAGIVIHILHISTDHKEEYKKLMDVSNTKTSHKNDSNYKAKQMKEGTAKTLLLTQGDERKIGMLTSKSSILYFAKENQSSELIEEMKQVHLIYQEDLIEDSSGALFQVMVELNAQNAIYYYSREKLDAEIVELARYRIPSHVFSKQIEGASPLFKGTADHVSITFGVKTPSFQATNLKAYSQ